ncbi:MAG: hypothetical protein IPO21_14230 [Bacteroidales bacterium]|nr:hypothetical protein [Bacteroidales bacterium]
MLLYSIKILYKNINRTNVLLIFLLFSTHEGLAHPLHLSVCTLNENKQQIEVCIKIFADDLAIAAEKELIAQYIQNKLIIAINEKPQKLLLSLTEIIDNA